MATTAIDQQRAHAAAGHGEKTGLWSWLTTVDHKRIGALYLYTALAWFAVGGLEAVMIRIQLQGPNGRFLTADTRRPFGPCSCALMSTASRPPMPNQASAVYR